MKETTMRRFIRIEKDTGGLITLNARHISSIDEFDEGRFTMIGMVSGDVFISSEPEQILNKRLEDLK